MTQKFNTYEPVMYSSANRNNGNPFLVRIINLNTKTAIVSTFVEPVIVFKCRISSLYPA